MDNKKGLTSEKKEKIKQMMGKYSGKASLTEVSIIIDCSIQSCLTCPDKDGCELLIECLANE